MGASTINSNINHTFQHSNQPQNNIFNMSDALRQSTTDKAASAMKPDSQKSATEKAGDSIKNTADNVAGSVQPSGEKGVGQKASDTVSGTNNDASKQGQSVLDSASQTLGNAALSAQDTLGMGKK